MQAPAEAIRKQMPRVNKNHKIMERYEESRVRVKQETPDMRKLAVLGLVVGDQAKFHELQP